MGHESAFRLFVKHFWRRDLLDHSAAKDGDPIRHDHGLLLIVRDIDDGYAQGALNAADFVLHFLAQASVERAERLVHQHEFWVEDQSAGDGNALLLTTG